MEELVQDEQDESEWHTLASWCCCAKTDESRNVGWFWSQSPRCVARFKRASMSSLKAWHIRAESMPLHKSATSLSDRTFMKFLHAKNLCPSRDCQLLNLWLPKRCFHGTQFHRFHTNFPMFYRFNPFCLPRNPSISIILIWNHAICKQQAEQGSRGKGMYQFEKQGHV